MDKISVIIPSFNRFKYLLNTIKSIKEQTYKNIEIIVINDKSSQKEYYEYDWDLNNIKIIHLKERSKKKFGYPCVGYVRNQGIKNASGKYIAFCDDDDSWFPHKIELQLKYIQKSGCKMSCTEGLFGNGIYDKNKNYKKFNTEHYYDIIKNKYKNTKFLKNGFPEIWNLDFLKIHNCIINSSVLVDKIILLKSGPIPFIRRGQDYQCWLNVLKHTDCIFVQDSCVYYDSGHGDGGNH